jgi:hypothetical protein
MGLIPVSNLGGFHMKTVLLASAAVLALSGSAFAGAAHPSLSGKASSYGFHAQLPSAGLGVIYSQRDNDNGVGIVSQNFESSFNAYDAQGADDFIVKKKAKVKQVDADGVYFNGAGPARDFNVTFYNDAGGTPGATVKACNGASYTDETGTGTPDIKCKAKLAKGTYWVSVQANLDFSAGGEWGWNTNNTVRGNASQWQNPGNGFATGCTTYTTTTVCIPAGEGGDNSFSLLGKGH